ncbi:MAG: conjugal transfer protein TraG [Methylovulum sp.]|nr:MAG: conjugal transfer protein TraG [Methylovulum sp.]
MAYEILSIGDGEMLYEAFQGAAMIFRPENINDLIKSGFVLGTLLITFKYLTDQQMQLNYGLVAVALYTTMFVPTDTVSIEDVYTGEVRTVANVPIGIAAPMSVVSTMGVKSTSLFETSFSTPEEASLLGHGYLDSLNTLIKIRNVGVGTAGSNPTLNGDLARTVNGYIENCVMYDMELPYGNHEVTKQKLEKADDLWESLKTTFINRDTLVYLPTVVEPQMTCNEAYVTINNYLYTSEYQAAWASYMNGVLGITDSSVSASDKIDVAAQALGLTALDAQKFMRNALMASFLRDGPTAFIQRTGVEQVKMQWSGEQSVFKEYARPIMSFVEMFTVATSDSGVSFYTRTAWDVADGPIFSDVSVDSALGAHHGGV